ncbi:MAG: peptide-binding protein [Desulfobulbus propionicus]|nr:MAG: peptide-binding protein [Desulfobulbus propionicus]
MNKRVVFFFLFFLMFFLPCELFAKMVSISGDDVNLRSGPGTQYKVVWQLGDGFPLKVLKRSGDWLRVQDFEGSVGWVHRKMTSSTPHMIVKVHKKNGETINIRSGPGTSNRIVAKAIYGVVFKTLEQKKGWAKVEHEEKGVKGWVSRRLLWGF